MTGAGFLDRLTYDAATGAHFDQSRRYMMIRPEALMGVFSRLEGPARGAAIEALGASVFQMGSDSARAYAEMGGGGAALAEIVARSAPELGWGIWTITSGPRLLTLSVANSPFAQGYGPSDLPVCHAISGMLRAVATLAFGTDAVARETQCAACGAPRCLFVAEPLSSADGATA